MKPDHVGPYIHLNFATRPVSEEQSIFHWAGSGPAQQDLHLHVAVLKLVLTMCMDVSQGEGKGVLILQACYA